MAGTYVDPFQNGQLQPGAMPGQQMPGAPNPLASQLRAMGPGAVPPAGAGAPPGSQPPPGPSPMAGAQAPGELDPAMIDSMLALSQQQPEIQAAQRQQKLADALRGDAAGQLRGQHAGRVFVAPGLANLGASIAGNFMAKREGDTSDATLKRLGKERTDTLKPYFKSLTDQLRGGGGAAASPYEG